MDNIWRSHPERTPVMRDVVEWRSKSGKHYVILAKDPTNIFTYRASDGSGGSLGRMFTTDAIFEIQRRIDLANFQPSSLKTKRRMKKRYIG